MKYEPPTDIQKRLWAYASVLQRGEYGNNVYELSETGTLYVLERTTSRPIKAGQVGYLSLVGVIDAPSPTLLENVRAASNWNN